MPLAGLGCGGNGGTDIVLPSLSVSTTTTGVQADPDGYSFAVDGQAAQPIGTQATVTVDRLADGQHTVELSGVAPNCSVEGENPRAVTVAPGATTEVSFAVTCTVPGPTTGSLEISTTTTGPNQDPDGYLLSVDGGANQPIGTNATVTLANVSAVQHTVQLLGLAANCAVSGDNPIGAAVPAGGTARVSFAVSCVATAGELAVTISGLPGGAQAAVTVSGPNTFSRTLAATQTLTGLVPGSYTVRASDVVSGGTTYTPSIGRPNVDVAAGATAAVTVSYTAVAPITLNLRIDGLYLTQSTQTYESEVPLVAGRAGYLRVFVVANESNTARPRVRVRFRNGSSTTTREIEAPSGSTPTTVQEGSLGSSWNLPVEAALIRPGLSIEATVDPGEAIDESNENDNRATQTMTVRTVPAARIRFVSVQQGSSAPGNVSNPDQLMRLARRIHPLNAIDIDVDPDPFPASDPLEANGNGWNQLLSDLDGKRVAEGTDRVYFGVVKLGYGRQDGLVGLTLGQGVPTAAGWDDAGDASRVVAHELGHVWNRSHSPCGNPPAGTVDPLYPHLNGQIGVYGMDVASTVLKSSISPDIMGYCFQDPWISDYTYREVMEFRAADAAASARMAGAPGPSLLIWGRMVNRRLVLEPVFQIVTRPSLPRRPGPYSVTGTASDGSRVFALSFDAAAAADDPQGSRHFAFAVPIDPAQAARLASVRLVGPGGAVANSRAPAQLRMATLQESVVARRQGQSVALQWDASVYPGIMVRDPDTGQVLSFARGGNARVWTTKREVDLEMSDGVQSQRLRLAINRP
jgi:hypothetical protein